MALSQKEKGRSTPKGPKKKKHKHGNITAVGILLTAAILAVSLPLAAKTATTTYGNGLQRDEPITYLLPASSSLWQAQALLIEPFLKGPIASALLKAVKGLPGSFARWPSHMALPASFIGSERKLNLAFDRLAPAAKPAIAAGRGALYTAGNLAFTMALRRRYPSETETSSLSSVCRTRASPIKSA